MTSDVKQAAFRFTRPFRWLDADWIATTYRCHPSGEQPPVMGLVFRDWRKGLSLFRCWTDDIGPQDSTNAIRLVIIEGGTPCHLNGYTIRIVPTAAKVDEPGQIGRMHPSPETAEMFEQFKAQYLLHGEFLLCPVVEKEDGQLWFNANAGIIKTKLYFRTADDIDENDRDAVVLKPVEAETALRELMEAANQQSREISEASDS